MSDGDNFPTVFRGYDPAAVEHALHTLKAGQATALQEAAQKAVEITKLQAANDAFARDLAEMRAQVEELEATTKEAAPPTYADLGPRIAQILTLAEEQAAELVEKASAQAKTLQDESVKAAAEVRAAADSYATETRSQADAQAAKITELAKRDADDIVDHAEREASARRGEAEALFESQRAKSASAAADFEKTLAARREKAATEFQALMTNHEGAIAAAEEKLANRQGEATKVMEQALAEAKQVKEAAQAEASQLVEAARANAERVRRDSERELAALASRRDSITGQLTNVRQMLATLGGASLAQVDAALADDAPAAKPTEQEPSAQPDSEDDAVLAPVGTELTDDADQVEAGEDAIDEAEVAKGRPADSVE